MRVKALFSQAMSSTFFLQYSFLFFACPFLTLCNDFPTPSKPTAPTQHGFPRSLSELGCFLHIFGGNASSTSLFTKSLFIGGLNIVGLFLT